MTAAHPWLALLAWCSATACVWSEAVVETRPAPAVPPSDLAPLPAREPSPQVPAPASDPTAARPLTEPPAAATQPLPPAGEATPDVTVPAVARSHSDDVAPPTEIAMIQGLLVLAPRELPAQAGAPGVIRLTLPVGTRAGKTGLAELAAEVVAELRLPTRAGGGLRGGLLRLGASLEVSVAATATAFEVTFPPQRWREVLSLLGTHLAQPIDATAPTAAFDALRLRLATRLAQAWSRAPLLAMVERMRAGRKQSLGDIVSQINLRTANEVAVFQRARYRAAGAVLGLWVPGVHSAELAAGIIATLSPWLDPQAKAALPFLTPLPIEAGVFWAPHEGPVDVALLVPQPTLDQPLSAELLVLHECLTHDGLAGRLGAAITDLVGHDVSFQVLPAGDTDQVVLFARARDDLVVRLYEAMSQVLNSFRLRPPDEQEIALAAARARMRLLAQIAQPADWLRLMSRLAYRRGQPDTLPATLARLARPARLDLGTALPVFASSALALAVVGGQPPVATSRLVQLVADVVVPSEKIEQLLPAEQLESAVASAKEQLDKVVEMLGGAAALRAFTGYREHVSAETGVGPSVDVVTAVRLGAKLRETTRVLATTIDTRLDQQGGVEDSGTQQVVIGFDEARARLLATARHPSAVLARYARGELVFRLLALRMASDRELAVLEEVTDRRDGMRIAIDTQARLVRSIEARVWHAEAGALSVREEFSDYRTVKGGLRVPFLRTRTVDDREPALRIKTLEFAAAEPSDDELR
jgi:predicted Zn-dependent peptidase